MVRDSRRGRVVPGAAIAAGLLALVVPAGAEASVVSRDLEQTAAQVAAYWTPERVRAARPAEELLAGIPAPNDLLDALLGGASPAPRSSAQRVPDAEQRPYRTHGKVLFTLEGQPYQCSATVVRARNRRLVATAAHCVYGDVHGSPPGGEFATNWMFIPGKDGGSEPFGRWTAARLAVPSQWSAAEDVRYDVGLATMKKRNGRRLQKVVGGREIVFKKGRNLRFDAYGYPAEGPSRFDGSTLFHCTSPAQGTDSGPSPAPTRIDCDMTAGSSGGGWLIGPGRLNSVVSYGYECEVVIIIPLPCDNPEEGKLFGPYFGGTIERLYRSQRGRLNG